MKTLQALQKGEKIITNAGIYGTIDTVYEDSFLIKTDSGSTSEWRNGQSSVNSRKNPRHTVNKKISRNHEPIRQGDLPG